jgi:protein ImuB
VSDAHPVRSLVVWCPDWPVQAAATDAALPPEAPIALIEKGLVHACSAAARAEGVRRGLKVREAQSRCAALAVLLYNPALDARSFEPVLEALEAGIPTLQVVRPGVVVIRAQGPARYYGGEREAALAVLGLLDAAGVQEARVGVADGPFAAEQAARRSPEDRIRIVPPGGSAAFLAPLPVALLGLPPLVALLGKLGVRTLGGFAALEAEQVRDRFGPEGEAAHRVAAGLDPRRVVARVKPADRTRRIDFEPPLERVDQIAFALRQTA